MKKTLLLLLCSVAIVIFSSCNDDSNNNGGTTPPVDTVDTTAKPKLGYIDFNHWHDIFLKDMATIKPLIRGTYVRDTISFFLKTLVYNQETDCGKFIIEYRFNSKNILVYIVATAYPKTDDATPMTLIEVLDHSKIISDELYAFIKSKENTSLFNLSYKFYIDGEETGKGLQKESWSDDRNHVRLWNYLADMKDKGFADNESFLCTEGWSIRDDVEFPDSRTPEILPAIYFGGENKPFGIELHFQRINFTGEDDDITRPDI